MRDHLFKLGYLAGGRIARIGSEEANRIITPVVGQSFIEQIAVVDERMNRQQLDRANA